MDTSTNINVYVDKENKRSEWHRSLPEHVKRYLVFILQI
jgi:hypothetical protein